MNFNSLTCGVVLCSCNGVRFIIQQLDSIVAQTVLPQEIVISDDQSEDGSWGLIQKWADEIVISHKISVTLIRNKDRLGVSSNFQQACSKINTDIVFLCDQDDIWLSNKIERVLEEFREADVFLVHSDARLVDGESADLGLTLFEALRFTSLERQLTKEGRFVDIYCRRNIVTGAATAFRRGLLSVASPFPSEWLHDEWLAANAAICGRVVMLPDCLILYRQHGSNIIGMPISYVERMLQGWRRMRSMSRSEFLQYRIRRLMQWNLRVKHSGFDCPKNEGVILGALEHFHRRSLMGENFFGRLPQIWREFRSKSYKRYSGFFNGILRDLLNV